IELVGPDRLAGFRTPRDDAGGPFVVARALLGIPRSGIGSTVVDQIETGIVGEPGPGRAAADFPLLAGPGFLAEILGAVGLIIGLEIRSDENVGIRSGGIGAPGDLAGFGI